jgi:hypothetical protein
MWERITNWAQDRAENVSNVLGDNDLIRWAGNNPMTGPIYHAALRTANTLKPAERIPPQVGPGRDNKRYPNAQAQTEALLAEHDKRRQRWLAEQDAIAENQRWARMQALGAPLTQNEINAIYSRYVTGVNPALSSAFSAGNASMRNELDAALGGIGMAFDRGRSLTDERIAGNRAAMEEAVQRLNAITAETTAGVGAMQSDMTGATDGGAAMALAPVTGAVADAGAAASANGSIAANLAQDMGSITNDDLQYLRGMMDVQQGAQAGAAQRLQAANMANFASQYAQLVAQEQAQQKAAAQQEIAAQSAERRDWARAQAEKEASQPPVNASYAGSQLEGAATNLTTKAPQESLDFIYKTAPDGSYETEPDGSKVLNPQYEGDVPDVIGMGAGLDQLGRYMSRNPSNAMQEASAYWSTFVAGNPVAEELLRRNGINSPADLVAAARSSNSSR